MNDLQKIKANDKVWIHNIQGMYKIQGMYNIHRFIVYKREGFYIFYIWKHNLPWSPGTKKRPFRDAWIVNMMVGLVI